MIFFFGGSDTQKIQHKSAAFLSALQKKRPDANVIKIEEGGWSNELCEELMQSQGLFEQKVIVVVKHAFEDEAAEEWVLKHLEALQESQNAFMFVESTLLAKPKKAFEKYAQTFEYFEKVEKKVERLSAFAFSDACGSKSSVRAWIEFIKIKDALAPEEIHGTLWWQFKSILLAGAAGSATDAGLNPFVFQKSKKYAGNFSQTEINDSLDRLVSMYHQAHRGQVDLGAELEKFAIGLSK